MLHCSTNGSTSSAHSLWNVIANVCSGPAHVLWGVMHVGFEDDIDLRNVHCLYSAILTLYSVCVLICTPWYALMRGLPGRHLVGACILARPEQVPSKSYSVCNLLLKSSLVLGVLYVYFRYLGALTLCVHLCPTYISRSPLYVYPYTI